MYRNLWRGVLKVVTVAKGEWKQCLAMKGLLVHTWGHRMLYTSANDLGVNVPRAVSGNR